MFLFSGYWIYWIGIYIYGRSRRRFVVSWFRALSWSNPVLAPEEPFLRPFFVRPKKIILFKRRGNSMKQKFLEMIQVAVWLHTDEFIFVWFHKNEKGRQNRYSCAKTGLLRRSVKNKVTFSKLKTLPLRALLTFGKVVI